MYNRGINIRKGKPMTNEEWINKIQKQLDEIIKLQEELIKTMKGGNK